MPEAVWQRCYVHFLRNALDHLLRKADDDCLRELRWLYDRRELAEARKGMAARISRMLRPNEPTVYYVTSRYALTDVELILTVYCCQLRLTS